jgi:hypothetical protein
MRVLFAATTAFLLLTGAAFAQANQIIDPDMLPENRAIDQQYRSALKRMPDPEESHDPWSKVRESEKPATKPKQTSGKKIN